MICSDLVARARETLRDFDKDRFTDDRIVAALNLGILDIRRSRPDFFIGRYAAPTFQITTLIAVFDLPDAIIPPLIQYAVGWIETADDEYSTDGRAAAMTKEFGNKLGIPT